MRDVKMMTRIERAIVNLDFLREISYQADNKSDAAGASYSTWVELGKEAFDDTIHEAITMLRCRESTVIPFTQRMLLSKCCDEWILKNGVSPETFSVITYLVSKGCIRLDDVYRIIGEEMIGGENDAQKDR